MEKESKTTRFCLICNYVSRIIEPIASRCTKFRFKPLKNELIAAKLKEISSYERIELENDATIDELIITSDGDLRKAITMLHTLSRLKAEPGSEDKNGVKKSHVTFADVQEIAGFIPNDLIANTVALAKVFEFVRISMCNDTIPSISRDQ